MNLLLVAPDELDPDGVVRLVDGRARHLLTVLRVTPGARVRVGLVDGPVGQGVVVGSNDRTVTLRCSLDGEPLTRPPVDLLLALPRPKVLKRLWAQLAALGVGRIVLTNAARVERDYFDTHVLDPATWRPLLIEGLQQARDTRVPEVSIHRRFRVLVEDDLDRLCDDCQVRLVGHPDAGDSMATVVGRPPVGRLLLAVGPEGGWTPFELSLLERHRFLPVALGARTLRSDTACVALLTLAHDALRTRQPSSVSRS